jgi:hypothetical protein
MTGFRPGGVSALSAFFTFGTLMSLISGLALSFPGSFLEPIWRLNPRARDGLSRLGPWGIVLMFSVSVGCALSASGLWRGAAWEHGLATAVLVVNLLGDAISALSGTEPRAAIGIPIGAALVAYLWSARVREFFAQHKALLSNREHG